MVLHPPVPGGSRVHEWATLIHQPGLVDGAEIDVHQRSECRIGAGIVHEDVARAEPIDGTLHHRIGVLFGVRPSSQRQHPFAAIEAKHRFIEVLLASTGDHDPGCARIEEAGGDRLADTP